MSINALNWVLQHSEAEGTDRLVLIALADYAHDDGGGIFAAVENIGRKARTKRRATQYALRSLEAAGRIERSGRTPRGTTVYKILFREGAQTVRPSGPGVQDHAPPGVQPDAPPGVQPHAPKPSNSNHPKQPTPPSPQGGQLQHPPSSGELWIDDVVSEVFEAWRIGTGKNGNSTLSPPRKKKIRLRLEEAMNGDGLAGARAEVLEAVAGMVNSTWHRENGHQEFSQLFRSRDTVEKFVTRFRKDNGGAATTIPRGQSPTPKGPNAEYDTTRKNPELED